MRQTTGLLFDGSELLPSSAKPTRRQTLVFGRLCENRGAVELLQKQLDVGQLQRLRLLHGCTPGRGASAVARTGAAAGGGQLLLRGRDRVGGQIGATASRR
ncbi:NF-kappa-B inhibitor epsilon [Trichinella pseudospiralis]